MIAAVCGRDREDAAGRCVREPSSAATRPARATSSRTAGSRTCASSASRPRTSSCSAHFGSLWLRLSTHGPFIHTAFSEGRRDENSILRMRDVLDAVLEWLPEWEERPMSYDGVRRRRQRRRDPGRLRLAGVANAAPHRPLPRPSRAADRCRWPWRGSKALDLVRGSERFPDYGVEARGLRDRARARRSTRATRSSRPIDAAHEEVFGALPERDVTRWFSDASALTRYGIADRQLRDVERPARRGVRREPRDRRARQDGRGVRAGRDAGLRRRRDRAYQMPTTSSGASGGAAATPNGDSRRSATEC